MAGPLPIFDGRRFGCTQCGNCCMEPGWVYMTRAELAAIAEHLELAPITVRRKYDVRWDRANDSWSIDATHGRGCPFLDPEGGCTVHPVKPEQCQTFPFWDELLDNAQAWEQAKLFCPGLDREDGRLYSIGEIGAIRAGRKPTAENSRETFEPFAPPDGPPDGS